MFSIEVWEDVGCFTNRGTTELQKGSGAYIDESAKDGQNKAMPRTTGVAPSRDKEDGSIVLMRMPDLSRFPRCGKLGEVTTTVYYTANRSIATVVDEGRKRVNDSSRPKGILQTILGESAHRAAIWDRSTCAQSQSELPEACVVGSKVRPSLDDSVRTERV